MRLFIAISLPQEIKNELTNNSLLLKKHSNEGRFPWPENYHLTLAFLGEVELSSLDSLKKIMKEFATTKPFTLKLSTISFFKRGNDGVLFNRLLDNSSALNILQKRLTEILKSNNFKVDFRPFKPHITLGRKVLLKPEIHLNFINNQIEYLSFKVQGITLFSSERINNKLHYEAIYHQEFLVV